MARKTKLNAINEMLRSIGESPVGALDTGGTSEQAEAERVLDAVSTRVQTDGWPDNTDEATPYTPTDLGGGVYEISLATSVLMVKSCKPNAYRNFTIRGGKVYDIDRRTTNMGSTATIYLDTVVELSFADCSPSLQERILVEAVRDYVRFRKGSPLAEQVYSNDLAMRDRASRRPQPSRSESPIGNPGYAAPDLRQQ